FLAPRHLHSFPTRRSSDLELGLAILVHPALTLELLVDPRRVLVPFAELALERPEVDLLLADLLLLSEDLGLPFFQLSDPGRLRRDRKSTRLNSSHDQTSYA